MIRFVVALITLVGVSGCADAVNRFDRGLVENTPGDYHLIKWSGGKDVEHYWLHNVKITQNDYTDGVFFIKDGNIYEVQGDITSVRLENGFEGPDVIPAHLLPSSSPSPKPKFYILEPNARLTP